MIAHVDVLMITLFLVAPTGTVGSASKGRVRPQPKGTIWTN